MTNRYDTKTIREFDLLVSANQTAVSGIGHFEFKSQEIVGDSRFFEKRVCYSCGANAPRYSECEYCGRPPK